MLLDQPLFAIDILADSSPATLRLSGELDAGSAAELITQGQDLIRAAHRHLIIDCQDLLFCDSAGLNAMSELWRLVGPDGSVTVTGPSDQLIRLLHITGLANLLSVPGDQRSEGASTYVAQRAESTAGRPVPAGFRASLPLPATGREVAQFVATRTAACVGANYSNLALLDSAGESLRLFHDTFLDPEMADRYSDVALDAPYPIAAAVREDRAVLLPDLDAYRTQFPEMLADTVAAGVQATASLPLYRADGTRLGAVGFAWTEPTPFDERLEAALRAVAELCVETVERSERYDAEHELVVALQGRLLGDLPVLDGVETAARYLPAGSVPSVGGDWYDGLLLDDSKIAFVVGDVAGHGIMAAADMALIRGMITALLNSGVPTADVFSEVSDVLAKRTASLLATAALAIIDVANETITFATAGHPPPLLRLPDGRVRTLDSANGAIIGIPSTRHIAGTAAFPLGSLLVMYTDGLVERRDRPFDVGVAQAARHLGTLPGHLSPADLIDSLIEEMHQETTADDEDDTAVLVIERSR